MSHGDSPDGFVFPPFIPPSAARAPAPQPAPAPAATPPPVMPWDAETPVVREARPEAAPADDAFAEELPWLELPEPRDAAAAVEPEAAPGSEDGERPLPDWMTWDARAEAEAEAELSSTAPVEGLEEFDPAASFGFETDPAGAEEAEAPREEEAFPFGEPDTFSFGGPEPDPAPEPSLGEISGLELEPGYGFEAETEEDGAYPAASEDEEQGFAPEPLEDPFALDEPPAAPAPFVADEEAVLAAEPDPFTAAEIAATEAQEPAEPDASGSVDAVEELRPVGAAAETAGASAFDEVASRLEEIARLLRERPDELLSGRGGDPLALLVTGYVMGYSQARRS